MNSSPPPAVDAAPVRARRVVENDKFAEFARRVLRAYARRVAEGDIEALHGLRQLSSDVDAAMATAVAGLRRFGYSWSEIARRIGVTRQAAQLRWGARCERGRLDDRLLNGGLSLGVEDLVVVYADHFRLELVSMCAHCGHDYSDAPECASLALASSLLYQRRHENPKALRLLTEAQYRHLHDRRGKSEQVCSVNQSDSGSSLFTNDFGRSLNGSH